VGYIKTFLIQTIENRVVHDFSFVLIEAINYHNWYNNEKTYDYMLRNNTCIPIEIDKYGNPYEKDSNDIVPIGSVEFVLDFLNRYYNINNVKPLNIPQELRKPEYLKRWIVEKTTDWDTINAGNISFFVKDNSKIKGWTNIVEPNRSYPPGDYLISELIDIDSEWRAFVYNRELVGLQNYSGDFMMWPNTDSILRMIHLYNDCPPAYTLDIGINREVGTFLIEVHNFYSCGLYGFADNRILPDMFEKSFKWVINKYKVV